MPIGTTSLGPFGPDVAACTANENVDTAPPPRSLSRHLIPPIAASGGGRSLVQMGLRRPWAYRNKGEKKMHTNRNMWLVS